MASEAPQSLSASIALGLSASRLAPIAPIARGARGAPRGPEPWSSELDRPQPRYQRALILAGSKRRIASTGAELERALQERGVRCDLHLYGGGHASSSARLAVCRPDVDLVVVVGGVGRLIEVLAALPRPLAVAYLPHGRRRSVARLERAYALPRDVDGLLEVILEHGTSTVPLAQLGSKLALFRAAFGFEALAARPRHKASGPGALVGQPAGVSQRARAALDALRHTFTVELDGRRLPGAYVNVAAVPGPDRLRVELLPARRAVTGVVLGLARTALGRPPRLLGARHVRVLAEPTSEFANDRNPRAIPACVDGRAVGVAGEADGGWPRSATIAHANDVCRLLRPTN